MIDGLDVSYWQGPIDWGKVAAAGKRFAIIRSGDGTFLDPLFEQNIRGALDAGLHVEIYHYLRFAYEPQEHSMILRERVELAKLRGASDRLWLDWEDMSEAAMAMTVGQRQVWADQLCTILKGRQVALGHYTRKTWWEPYMGTSSAYDEPLWVAQYPFIDGCQTDPTKAGLAPTLPSSWDDWLVWQYTSKGRCPGIEGYVDLNVAQDSFLKEEQMPGLTEERLDQILTARGEANKLEWAARGAVADKAFAAVLTALTGHWENLEGNLESIKAEATHWHRWSE